MVHVVWEMGDRPFVVERLEREFDISGLAAKHWVYEGRFNNLEIAVEYIEKESVHNPDLEYRVVQE